MCCCDKPILRVWFKNCNDAPFTVSFTLRLGCSLRAQNVGCQICFQYKHDASSVDRLPTQSACKGVTSSLRMHVSCATWLGVQIKNHDCWRIVDGNILWTLLLYHSFYHIQSWIAMHYIMTFLQLLFYPTVTVLPRLGRFATPCSEFRDI